MFTPNYIHLKEIKSTNSYLLSLKNAVVFKEGLVITSDFQTSGKGQISKEWESQINKNLLFSILIEANINIENQFDLSILSSLSVVDCLSHFEVKSQIKWPNDILVNKQKVSGILIQNLISKSLISHSIVGVGLNVNQLNFKSYKPEATSLRKVLNKEIDILKVKKVLVSSFQNRLEEYRSNKDIREEYLSKLFNKDKVATFESSNTKFMGIIRGITNEGYLQIETEDSLKEFNLQEVKMLF